MPLLDIAVALARLFVGSTLIVAGLLKLRGDSGHFLRSILAYDLVRGRAVQLIAKSLPWLEVGCGLFLLSGFFLPLTALASFGLLLTFTIAVTHAIVRQKQVGCGCFGTTNKRDRVRWQLTYRNLGLMGLTIVVFGFGPGWLAIDGWLNPEPHSLSANEVILNGLIAVWLTAFVASVYLHFIARQHVHHTRAHNAANIHSK